MLNSEKLLVNFLCLRHVTGIFHDMFHLLIDLILGNVIKKLKMPRKVIFLIKNLEIFENDRVHEQIMTPI